MAPRAAAWLWTRSAVIAALGFVINLIGALGAAFYLEPAQKAEDAAAQDIAIQSARSRMIRAATSYDNIAEHLGGLLFSVSLPADASDQQRAATGDLMMRALNHRHDGVRAYLAALAVAGAIDYPAESKHYETLVAAETANFSIDTYRAANAYEGDLATRMVKAEGNAAMRAIALQRDRRDAKRTVSARAAKLMAVAMLGSTLVFLATVARAGPKSPDPPSRAMRLLALAHKQLRARSANA